MARTKKLGYAVNRLPDVSTPVGLLVLMAGCRPWDGTEHLLATQAGAPCPVCGDATLAAKRYCLGCDACGLDGLVHDGHLSYPGSPVGSSYNPGYEQAEPTKYTPPPLRGGLGARVRAARARRAG